MKATLEFHGQQFNFSAGHFTIFSATEREPLHGHNYHVEAKVTANMDKTGLCFDYRIFEKYFSQLLAPLDSHFLLPAHSPYLSIEEQEDYYIAHFNQEKIPFLKKDVVILPIANITLEALSQWIIGQLTKDEGFMKVHQITRISVKIFNGPHHASKAHWEKKK